MGCIDFYFDYLTPYAYFAWVQVRKLGAQYNLEVVPKPVVFGALLQHYGHLGPAEIPPKREWTLRYCVRYAAIHQIPLVGPKTHPFRSLMALRLTLVPERSEERLKVCTTLFDAIWGKGIDGANESELVRVLGEAGLNTEGWLSQASSTEVKQALRASTEEAIRFGAFGVPFTRYNEEGFWGNDGLEHLRLVIEGKDPLDQVQLETMLARPAGVQRQR